MRRLRKFLRLSPADRRLLVTAALLQAAIRLGLVVLPYRRLRQLVDRAARVRRLAPTPPERIAWAVTRTSRSVPGAACLTQALALRVLLERRGQPARVRVGVMRADGARLLAHAWVESGGRVLLGGADLARYTPLAPLEAGEPARLDA